MRLRGKVASSAREGCGPRERANVLPLFVSVFLGAKRRCSYEKGGSTG